MGVLDDQTLSIYPSSAPTINGMFYLLNSINSAKRTRYSIKGDPRTSSTTNGIDDYSSTECYWSFNNRLNLTFTFDSPFFVTNYGIMNASGNLSKIMETLWN